MTTHNILNKERLIRCLRDPRLVSITFESELHNGLLFVILVTKLSKSDSAITIASDCFVVRQFFINNIGSEKEISITGKTQGQILDLFDKIKLRNAEAIFRQNIDSDAETESDN